MSARKLQKRLRTLGDPEAARKAERFFKTGPGESGEGLRFLGVNAPAVRSLAKEYRHLPLAEVGVVLHSDWHEARAVALVILTLQFPRAELDEQKAIYDLYLASTPRINSWALVDISAPQLVGAYLFERSRKPLEKLARSSSLWERRIAIVATQYFIRQNDFETTLRLAKILRDDAEDLIHKAVGWMLREVGDRDRDAEERFLRDHYRQMPRTMLRYAIEKFPEKRRKGYLAGAV